MSTPRISIKSFYFLSNPLRAYYFNRIQFKIICWERILIRAVNFHQRYLFFSNAWNFCQISIFPIKSVFSIILPTHNNEISTKYHPHMFWNIFLSEQLISVNTKNFYQITEFLSNKGLRINEAIFRQIHHSLLIIEHTMQQCVSL